MYQALLSESKKIGVFGHGFTYGGHPVSAAVALKAIEIYPRDRIFAKAAERAPQFQARLAALGGHPLVGEARGLGLIGGVELVADKNQQKFLRPPTWRRRTRGAVRRSRRPDRSLGPRRRFDAVPPLVISEEEIDELFDRLGRALDKTLDWVTRERLAQS